MKKLRSHLVGVDQGNVTLFSDFDVDGEMWTGTGKRERRQRIGFSEPYTAAPSVFVSLSMWDVDAETNVRADVQAEDVTAEGFDMVFRTWGDTRVARVRIAWQAVGELPNADDWTLY